ncbi:hypothetical protein AMECASPLE_031737 [Ameca splendens]|uniref:Uncharacterized protein n=1 Tax=Ameca splendens TaxID=208324 RepID=A0ABV0ZG68_9TELE
MPSVTYFTKDMSLPCTTRNNYPCFYFVQLGLLQQGFSLFKPGMSVGIHTSLQTVQKAVTRVSTWANRKCHITPVLSTCICSLDFRIQCKILVDQPNIEP